MSHRVTIDLVTYKPDTDKFIIVLVEEGPWAENQVRDNLERLQDRLYNCVDVAVDGHLATKYPDSRGKGVVIRLDCYDTPETEVESFFSRFTGHIRQSDEIQHDIVAKGFVASLEFEYNRRTLPRESEE